jgi:hypothetical protein
MVVRVTGERERRQGDDDDDDDDGREHWKLGEQSAGG